MTLAKERDMFVDTFANVYSTLDSETLRLKGGQKVEAFLHNAFDVEEHAFKSAVDGVRFYNARVVDDGSAEEHEEGEVIGFLSVDVDEDGESECEGEGGRMYLRQMAVASDWQGRGVGQALVRAAVEDAADVHLVTVAVRRFNEKAKRFYSRLGFREEGKCEAGLDPELYCGMVWTLRPDEADDGGREKDAEQ